MHGTARNFFTLAIIYSLLGMMLGLSMAMSHDHSQMPTHAHIMVLGWLMSAIFAFFYHLVPVAGRSILAKVHFWLAAVSTVGMFVGLFVLYGGNPAIEFRGNLHLRVRRVVRAVADVRESPGRASRRPLKKIFRGLPVRH